MKDDEADENRTPDLRIAKPTFTLIVTFNQSHTHSDFHAFGLKRTLEDRKGQQSAPLWLHSGVPTLFYIQIYRYIPLENTAR